MLAITSSLQRVFFWSKFSDIHSVVHSALGYIANLENSTGSQYLDPNDDDENMS